MTIEDAVAVLQRDPQNAAAQARLQGIISADRARYQKVVAPLRVPLDDKRRHQIVVDAYDSLLRGLDDDASAVAFVKGVRDYDEGRLLSAWDRFAFVAAMNPSDDWMISQSRGYLDEKIPSSVALRIAALRPPVRDAYRRGWIALRSRQWRLLPPLWARWTKDPAFSETAALLPAVERRAQALELSLQGLRAQLEVGLRDEKSAPDDSVQLLEPLLYQSDWLSASELQQARETLSRAFARAEFQDRLAQMRASYRSGDLAATRRMIVAVLTKDPKNAEAAAYLLKLQQRANFPQPAKAVAKPARKVKDAAAVRAEAAPRAPAAAPKPAPVAPTAAPAKAPAPAAGLTDQVQSDAYYNRGLGAYYRGDLAKACAEWQKSVDLNPSNEKARLALKRATDELGLQKQKSAEGAP